MEMEIDITRLIDGGMLGVFVVWFMFRLERILSRLDRTVDLAANAVIRLLERRDPAGASELSKALYGGKAGDE